MKRTTIYILFLSALAFSSCTSATTKVSLEDQIAQTNKNLIDSSGQLNKPKAKEYVQLTSQFIQSGTDSLKVLKLTYQGAEVAVNLGDFGSAINMYDALVKRYPNQPKIVAEALFAKAFILENHLNKIEEARIIYQEILHKYPNQGITKSIPGTLQNLGKTEAELIEMIKNKNK